jgi:hypothetical protein
LSRQVGLHGGEEDFAQTKGVYEDLEGRGELEEGDDVEGEGKLKVAGERRVEGGGGDTL